MKLSPLTLGPDLSAVSWFFIEIFALIAILLLPFSKSAAEISVTIGLGLWILRKFPWDEEFPRVPFCTILYMALFAVILLSLSRIPADNLATGLHGAGKWLKYLGIFFMSSELFADRRRARRFTAVFFASMALVCADGLYQMAAGRDLVKNYSVDIPGRFVRMQGPFTSPNDLAAFFLLALPLIFFSWIDEKKWSGKSVVLVLLLALFSVSFISTLSRSALLGLFLAAALYALLNANLKILWVTLLSPAVLWLSPLLRYNFFGSLVSKDITAGERLQMWQATLRMIRAHPWLGNGVNTYTDALAAGGSFKGYAHNCYLQMASEIGMPGLLLFLIPFLALVPRLMAEEPRPERSPLKTALLIGIPAFLFQSALDTNLYAFQAAMLFWFFWGMLVALRGPLFGAARS